MRLCDLAPRVSPITVGDASTPEQFVWFKPTGRAPSEHLVAASLLVFESDNVLIGTARLPHRGRFEREHMQVASLDHAMWFHRP